MFGTFSVGLLHLRVIPTGAQNACLEIVDDHPLGNSPKELEGVTV